MADGHPVVNQFFSTYYEAVTGSVGAAQLSISAIVNELDPVAPKDGFNIMNILSMLAFGLAFLGAPTIAVGILTSDVTMAVKLAAQALLISMSQTPGFVKALLPSGTVDSKFIQIGQLETDLGSTVAQLEKMINKAITLLANDLPTFVNFVGSGQYSSVTSYAIPSETTGLEIALTTYLASEAMAGNGWYSSVAVGPYSRQDVIDSYQCEFQENDICLVTTSGVSLPYYHSPDSGRVFSLVHKDGYQDKTVYQVMQDLVNNQWAPLNVLFDGAFNCTMEGKNGIDDIQFTFNGTLDIACISRLPIMGGGCKDGGQTVMGIPGKNAPIVCPTRYYNGSCPFSIPKGFMGCGD